MTCPDKLYSKEQIQEWASKRADDAGRLSCQLLDTMRENERLREALQDISDGSEDSYADRIARKALKLEPYKHSETIIPPCSDPECSMVAMNPHYHNPWIDPCTKTSGVENDG